MLDLCCAIVGEDEKGYISNILEKIATRVPAPITIDSTEADVVEEALKRIPGKAIINSINFEDGEKRTAKVLPMAKRYGAAVIALTIDEDGMALTAEKKLVIAKRIFDLAVNKYGIRPVDLIFDALTLPISTGRGDATFGNFRGDPAAVGQYHPGLPATVGPVRPAGHSQTENRLAADAVLAGIGPIAGPSRTGGISVLRTAGHWRVRRCEFAAGQTQRGSLLQRTVAFRADGHCRSTRSLPVRRLAGGDRGGGLGAAAASNQPYAAHGGRVGR